MDFKNKEEEPHFERPIFKEQTFEAYPFNEWDAYVSKILDDDNEDNEDGEGVEEYELGGEG